MELAFTPTPRQLDALRWIRGFQLAHGTSPTLEQIAAGLGLKAKSGSFRLVSGLEERGHLRRQPNHAIAIEILGPVAVPHAPSGAPLFFIPIRNDGDLNG